MLDGSGNWPEGADYVRTCSFSQVLESLEKIEGLHPDKILVIDQIFFDSLRLKIATRRRIAYHLGMILRSLAGRFHSVFVLANCTVETGEKFKIAFNALGYLGLFFGIRLDIYYSIKFEKEIEIRDTGFN